MILVPAGIFTTATTLTNEATATVRIVIGLGAIIFVAWRWFEKRTLTSLVIAGITAGVGVWLVYGGINTFRDKVSHDLASAPTSDVVSVSSVFWGEPDPAVSDLAV